MELALMIGKWLFVGLIYLFVFVVCRGLIREGMPREDKAAPARESPRLYRRETPSQAAVSSSPHPGPNRVPPARPQRHPSVAQMPLSASQANDPTSTISSGMSPTARKPLKEEPVSVSPAAAVIAPQSVRPLQETGERTAAAKLTVIHSQTPEIPVGHEYPLLAAATIGRADYNAIVLADQFASMQHAIVFLQDGRRVLRDRGSTNGTLLNGRKVTIDVVLRDGDQISIGTTVLQYFQSSSGGR